MRTFHMRPLLLVFLLLVTALPGAARALRVQDGDLLFVTATTTGLSGAIDDATAREGAPSFDHVALVASDGEDRVVLHADAKGSRQQPLSEFLAEAEARQRQVVVYRLEHPEEGVVPDAIAQARRMLGKPYNLTYVQDEDSYYCSDFIERAFRAHQVFALQPMNFRNPQTGQFAAYWIDFYRGRGMEVPQDAPGTNPNDMARTPGLRLVGTLD